MTRYIATIIITALGMLFVITACSGGGEGSPSPAQAGSAGFPPIFISSTTVTLEENRSGVFYQVEAVANGGGGEPVVTLLAGGDGALFRLDTLNGNRISPVAPFDFEAPADTNRDNVYELNFEARNTVGAVQLALRVTVTNIPESLELRRVATGFSQPLYLEALPGTSDVVVVEKQGRIRVLSPDTGAISSVDFLNLTGMLSVDGERGLLGLAFSPEFTTDRTFYVNLTNPAGNTEIRRYRMFTGSTTQADPATGDIILTIAQPFSNHNAGWIGFANSGLLYVPTGDGGGSGDPQDNAQNPNSLLGKVLRLDLSGDDFPSDPDRDYRIPPGNFFSTAPFAPEVFALGLRNPFRASVDPQTGNLWIGDVGQNAIEEIDLLGPGDAGANFGWRLREGTLAFNGGANQPGFTAPVAEYTHGSGPTEGRSVTGGYLYRGNLEAIRNHYVFADFGTANVWAVPETALVAGPTVAASAFTRLNPQLVPDAGTLTQISSFGLDGQGRLYIVSLGGDIFRIEAAP